MRAFTPRVTSAELQQRYRAEGLWNDDTFAALATRGLAADRETRARVLSAVRPYEGTVGDIADQAARLAGLLASRGIGAGDVVAFQLPNWAEAVATFYALLRIGAVNVPIVHIYGHSEVGHILGESGARAFVTTDRFGSHDYLADLDTVLGSAPELDVLVFVATLGSV